MPAFAIARCAPRPYRDVRVVGLSQVSGFGKAGGPAISGPIFAWSITNGLPWPLDHSLIFYAVAVMTAVVWWVSVQFPNDISEPYREATPRKLPRGA